MSRKYNFSAGPAALPLPVLEQIQNDLLDWQGTGMSVMEMSHRGKAFVSIAEAATADMRELLAVPDDYEILWLQGGATGQFSAIPQNILGDKSVADYVVTGSWGKKAVKEAGKYCDARTAAKADPFTGIPDQATWSLSDDAGYVHYTPNETIEGVEFHNIPDTAGVPLVADYSSSFMSRPIDVAKHGLIYAGAQKNLGPAGITVVIVRKDLLGKAAATTPMVFDYAMQADKDSMLNTPACFSWYVCGLTLQWIKTQGGLEAIGQLNQRKADKLYAAIDGNDFYANPVDLVARSRMNVPFTLASSDLDGEFLAQAEAADLSTLKGHRSVGGMRASIYNAMPEAGVDALIEFMTDFASKNG